MGITPHDVAVEIGKKIQDLEGAKAKVKERLEKRAKTSAEYDKAIAVTLIGLKNGKSYKIDDIEISNPPASIMDKLARGICWQEKLEMEIAEAEYKSIITYIETTQSQLMGWQSINKFQSEV